MRTICFSLKQLILVGRSTMGMGYISLRLSALQPTRMQWEHYPCDVLQEVHYQINQLVRRETWLSLPYVASMAFILHRNNFHAYDRFGCLERIPRKRSGAISIDCHRGNAYNSRIDPRGVGLPTPMER